MNRADILRELGWPQYIDVVSDLADRIERVVRLAEAAEREACAMTCEQTTASWTQHLYNEGVMDCVKAIRARGNS